MAKRRLVLQFSECWPRSVQPNLNQVLEFELARWFLQKSAVNFVVLRQPICIRFHYHLIGFFCFQPFLNTFHILDSHSLLFLLFLLGILLVFVFFWVVALLRFLPHHFHLFVLHLYFSHFQILLIVSQIPFCFSFFPVWMLFFRIRF